MLPEWVDSGRKKKDGRPIRVKDQRAVLINHMDAQSDGCAVWTASRNLKGYGLCKLFGENFAHRASWVAHFGPIPVGMFVCHACDNPPCVNPSHLFLGSAADNSADMVAKGRAPRNAGDRSGMARVSDADVHVMRALRAEGLPLKVIAARFSISDSQTSRICSGKSRTVVEFAVPHTEEGDAA